MGVKLTDAQRRVLENLAADRRPGFGFKEGRSTAGGLSGTFVALHKKGLIRDSKITAAGRLAIATDGEG